MTSYNTDYRSATNQVKALTEIAYLASEIHRAVSEADGRAPSHAMEVVKDCVLKMNHELLQVSNVSSVHED